MRPVVCIAAAGKGTRVGSPWHKALLPINDKAIISHIIESFEQHVDIVIAVGHQKEIIKAYCKAAYPFRNITYVEVGNYDGEGSGPGFSMNCCRKHLQRPFWFITCDCLVKSDRKWSAITCDWIGVSPVTDPALYSTVKFDRENAQVTDFVNKSPKGYADAYIGFCAIKEYETFWKAFDNYLANRTDKECEHVGAFYDVSRWKESKLLAYCFHSWKDTGSLAGYQQAKKDMSKKLTYHFEKSIDEITYQLPVVRGSNPERIEDGGKVIKLDHVDKIKKKKYRASKLAEVTPSVTADGNILSYAWIDGKLLYEIDKAGVFMNFVKWCKDKMWIPAKAGTIGNFKESCRKFYRDKTIGRMAAFRAMFPTHLTIKWHVRDNKYIADETLKDLMQSLPKVSMDELFDKIDWDWLTDGVPVIGHGDLNFGNAILLPDTNHMTNHFKLIDWREDFADQQTYLDIYYDLAKLYAGVDVSWMKIHENMQLVDYFTSKKQTCVSLSTNWHMRTPDLMLFKELYEKWIVEKGYDLQKVKTIAALIYLNMSPLHGKEMGEFLFFLALERLSHVVVR